ncbi:MAG: hypothetical protein ACQESF_05980 [Nanobdellota archaeon]
MSNHSGMIKFGPYYMHGDEKYFVVGGEVLKPDMSEVGPNISRKIKALHNFYLSTFFQPLFYSPTDNKDQRNMSDLREMTKDYFENRYPPSDFSDDYLNLNPDNFLINLEKNIKDTNKFLQYATYNNALNVLKQNRKTLFAYSENINNVLQLFSMENMQFNENLLLNYKKNLDNSHELFKEKTKQYKSIVEEKFNVSNKFYDNNIDKYETAYDVIYIYSYIQAIFEQVDENLRSLKNTIKDKEKILKAEENFKFKGLIEELSQKEYHDPESFNSINKTRALLFFNKYIDEEISKELGGRIIKKYNKIRSIDQIKAYEINIEECAYTERLQNKENIIFYGVYSDFYPNIMFEPPENLTIENYHHGKDVVFATNCECPSKSEVYKLEWYVIDDMNNLTKQNNLTSQVGGLYKDKISKAEKIFVNYPSTRHLKYLSETYRTVLLNIIENGTYDKSIKELWERSTKSRSRIYMIESTFERYYNKIYPDATVNLRQYDTYLYYHLDLFMMDSMFELLYMPWSSTLSP